MSVEAATSQSASAASSYDHDAIIASITRYYELLSKTVSIKPADIGYARKGGRSDKSIPLSKLRRLGFNDRMIDFIRHVPFCHSNDRPVFPETTTLNHYPHLFYYPEEDYKLEDADMTGMWPIEDSRIPQGIIPLSVPLEGSSLGTWWMLDTNNGELTARGPYITRPPEEVPEDEEWRSSRPVPAVAYFDGLYEDLISLQMIPLPHPFDHWTIWEARDDKIYASDTFMSWAKEARAIYRQCHWPDLRYFQRAKCRRLLLEMLARYDAHQDEYYKERKRQQQLASGEESVERAQTPPVPIPESPPREAPWGTEKIEVQTESEGMFVTTTFKM